MAFTDILSLATVEIFGDFCLRWFAQTGIKDYLYGGIAGYIGVIYFLIRSFRHDNVLYVNGMWDGISGLIESFAAFFILGDRLQNPVQYVGLAMTVIGIFLLKRR